MQGLDLAFYKGRSRYHTRYDAIPWVEGGERALWAMMETADGAGSALLNQNENEASGVTGTRPVYFDCEWTYCVPRTSIKESKCVAGDSVRPNHVTVFAGEAPHLQHRLFGHCANRNCVASGVPALCRDARVACLEGRLCLRMASVLGGAGADCGSSDYSRAYPSRLEPIRQSFPSFSFDFCLFCLFRSYTLPHT